MSDKGTFEGGAGFDMATFEGETLFYKATFEGDALFYKATFKKSVRLDGATFEGSANFSIATFEGNAKFTGATFTGLIYLNLSQFRVVPDFRHTDFQKHVTLHGMKVNFRRPAKKSDADMYRRLKELAVHARDHDREQMFFAYELIAKRGHETRGLKLIPNYLYELFGDFGRSLAVPSGWLVAVWFTFGLYYQQLTSKDLNRLLDGLEFSTAQLFPFIGVSKNALKEARAALFGTEPLSMGVNILAFLEGGLCILFLFLIGLALRNRFRI